MEYTVGQLARMAGVSTRTLRYYDSIGLLRPSHTARNGYRVYRTAEVDTLQLILFYRELGLELSDIAAILSSPDFDRLAALESHLIRLEERRNRLDDLARSVRDAISHMKGEIIMNDNEKFEAFKDNLIRENEEKYGAEIRQKYGDAEVDSSNARLKGMTPEQYAESERIGKELSAALTRAVASGDPGGGDAQHACDLHRRWLSVFYPAYNREYHLALGEMYLADERFRKYYDDIVPGGAEMLSAAIKIYCK